MYKVAVITRTKDRPIFLERALQSVARQTYKDYVHIIVNDGGSRDDIERLIKKLNDEHKIKIKIFHRELPSDAPDTIFNESIDRVDSEFFAIHDDDDTWHEDFLRETVEYLNRNNDLAAAVVRTNKIFEEVKASKIVQKKVVEWMPDLKVINLYRQCIDNQFTPISTLFRRSSYVSVGKFDTSLPVVGDWEFGVRLLLKYDAGFLDPGYPLANYHHRKKVGSNQDAVSSDEKHRYYTNKVMNTYLREELTQGRLGVGYFMNTLKYEESRMSRLAKRMLPAGIVKALKRKVGN